MGWKVKKGKAKNKKVKNATPLEVDGIKFRSKLEAYCYSQLLAAGLESYYEQNTYTLIPAFEYNGEKVRPCTYTPDFVGDGWIIEVKGFANDAFPIKWKMFKQLLAKTVSSLDLYLPKNQGQVREVIAQILSKKQDNEAIKGSTQ